MVNDQSSLFLDNDCIETCPICKKSFIGNNPKMLLFA